VDSEDPLRALREAAAGCMIRLDPEGRIVEFNTAAAQVFGCRVEDALGRPLAQLAVEARLRDITEKQRAEVQLAVAIKDLESLSYSISHDFRAPLRHLDGFVSLLAEELGDGLSGDARHFLDVIAGASLQMNELIESLLSLSRAGTAPLRTAPVDMHELVAQAVQEALRKAGSRTIAWDIGPLPVASGDRALLQRAWTCLIDNAVKFTRNRSEARITVWATRSDQETIYFVRDNGAGFDMNHAGKLFGVFQRLHHAREFEGTGIGLAIVHRIVARHGGRTWAEGRTGEGATVYFTLPAG